MEQVANTEVGIFIYSMDLCRIRQEGGGVWYDGLGSTRYSWVGGTGGRKCHQIRRSALVLWRRSDVGKTKRGTFRKKAKVPKDVEGLQGPRWLEHCLPTTKWLQPYISWVYFKILPLSLLYIKNDRSKTALLQKRRSVVGYWLHF